MQLPSDMPIAPVNSTLTVGTSLSSSYGSATSSATVQNMESSSVSLPSEVEWTQENPSEINTASSSALGQDLNRFVLENFNIITELTALPQTGSAPQATLTEPNFVSPPNAALTAEALPVTDSLNGNYTMTAVFESGAMTVTAQRQDGASFQSTISEYQLSSFSAGDTLTLSFQGPETASFQLAVVIPSGGMAQLAKLLSTLTLSLSGGAAPQPAAYTTLATFPGADAIPLSTPSAELNLSNGVTVYISPLLASDKPGSAINQGQSSMISSAASNEPGSTINQGESPQNFSAASQKQSPSNFAATSGQTVSINQPNLNPLTSRVLLHSADHIEIGTGNLIPIFEADGSPVFAAVTLANVSADSPLVSAGGGTLLLSFISTGETITFNIQTGEAQYTSNLTAVQMSNFLNSNQPIPLVFANTNGLPDTITLSLLVATVMDEELKRTQTRQLPKAGWQPDAATLGLAGSAGVPIPKKPNLWRASRRTLLGKLTLSASVLSLNPVGTFLGGVTALVGTMAQADNDDTAIEDEPDYIPDVQTAKERAQALQQAVLQYGITLARTGSLKPQQVYSLLSF